MIIDTQNNRKLKNHILSWTANLPTFLFLLLFLFASSASLQTVAVYDFKTSAPLNGATVMVTAETVINYKTDKDGVLELGSYLGKQINLNISHVGYESLDSTLTFNSGSNLIKLFLLPLAYDFGLIVVTGTRSEHILKDVPVQTELIGKEQFEKTGSVTVDEALESSVGININNEFSGKSLSIRGISGDQVLVMINGERVVGRVGGAIDLRQFSLTNVKQIEIIKGTGSTLYGSDAMGGVVNIIEETPKGSYSRPSVTFDFGSYKSFKPAFKYSLGNSKSSASLNLSFLNSGGFDVDETTLQTNGEEKTKRVNIGIIGKTNLTEKSFLKLSLRGMRENLGWVEEQTFAGIPPLVLVRDVDETNSRYDGSVTYSYIKGEKYAIDVKLYGSYYDHNFDKIDRETDSLVSSSLTEDIFGLISFNGKYQKNDNLLVFGAELSYQDFRSKENDSLSDSDKLFASYLQYEIDFLGNFTFLPGLRFEKHEAFGAHTNPSLNILIKAAPSFNIRLFTGYGFRVPSIKQQYYVFDHLAQGYKVIGGSVATRDYPNLNLSSLRVEESINSSFSFEYASQKLGRHRFTYFYNHLRDLIDFTVIGFDPLNGYTEGIFAYQNIETALTQGIELESRLQFDKKFSLSASYDYLDARNLVTGGPLPNRSVHTSQINFDISFEKLSATLSIWGRHQSSQLIEDGVTALSEGKKRPSRNNLNLNMSKKLSDKLKTFLRMENIIGETDQEFGFYDKFQLFFGFRYQ